MFLPYKSSIIEDMSCEFMIVDSQAELFMDIIQNDDLLNHLFSFLGFKELCNFRLCSKKISDKNKTFKKHLRNLVMKVGINSKLRPNYWICTSKAYKLQNLHKASYYYDLTFAACPWEKDIKKDIDRTFCSSKVFREKQGQLRLYRVLRAFATHYKQIGYIQGVNYLAATLLTLYNESDSFFVLSALFENMGLKTLYDSKMEGLRIYVQMFDYLMDLYCPDLYEYLQSQDICSLNYFTQWISTLFSYDLSRDMVFKIWDLFLLDGWKIIYKIALAIMKSKRQKIYKVAPESLMAYLRQIHKKSDFDVDKLIATASEIELSNRLLRDLKDKLTSGADIKKVRLRFDIKKGKRFWEFQEANMPEISTPASLNKSIDVLSKQSVSTPANKETPSIFSTFFGAIRSQFDFSQKKPTKTNNENEDLDKSLNRSTASVKTPAGPKTLSNLPNLDLSMIEGAIDPLNLSSFDEHDSKSLIRPIANTPQSRGTHNTFFEKTLSQKALTPRNAPLKTYR